MTILLPSCILKTESSSSNLRIIFLKNELTFCKYDLKFHRKWLTKSLCVENEKSVLEPEEKNFETQCSLAKVYMLSCTSHRTHKIFFLAETLEEAGILILHDRIRLHWLVAPKLAGKKIGEGFSCQEVHANPNFCYQRSVKNTDLKAQSDDVHTWMRVGTFTRRCRKSF